MAASSIATPEYFSTTDLDWLQSWRLQPKLDSHWEVFSAKYFPYIKRRIGKYYLMTQDEEDLQQEIFAKILINIKSIARPHKGSFRAWLKRVINCALSDWFEQAARRRSIPALDPNLIHSVVQETTTEIEEDHFRNLMRSAILQTRFDLKPSTWEMFEETKIRRKPAAEVARIHRVSVLTVYDANRRVMERLREVISLKDKLEDES